MLWYCCIEICSPIFFCLVWKVSISNQHFVVKELRILALQFGYSCDKSLWSGGVTIQSVTIWDGFYQVVQIKEIDFIWYFSSISLCEYHISFFFLQVRYIFDALSIKVRIKHWFIEYLDICVKPQNFIGGVSIFI